MSALLRFVAGSLTGAVLYVWVPSVLQPAGLPMQGLRPEEPVESTERAAPEPAKAKDLATPKVMPLKVSISEVLHTGDPTQGGVGLPEIKGNLPKNLRFRWVDDPASGLAPAFLWQRGETYTLGTRRIAAQDGDIRAAYAFEAPAVLPDQHGGRLIFHKRVLARLLEWAAEVPEAALKEPLFVTVSKTGEDRVGLRLPATPASKEIFIEVQL